MGTIARRRGAGLEKYSLCGGACHSRPGPRAAGWALSSQLQRFGGGAPGPGPGPLGILEVPQNSRWPGVTLQHSPDQAYSGLFLTANVQPRVCTTQAQARPESGPSFRASLGTPCRPGYTLSHRSVPVPKASATSSNARYCVHPAASETHLVECGLRLIHITFLSGCKPLYSAPLTASSGARYL